MVKSLLDWLPKLSRRAWMGLGCVYLATLPVLYFTLPIRPAVTLRSSEPLVVLGFGKDRQTLLTLGCDLDDKNEIARLKFRGPLIVWDLQNGAPLQEVQLPSDAKFRNAVLAPDGQSLVCQTDVKRLLIFSLQEQKLLRQLDDHLAVGWKDYSPGGSWFLAGRDKGSLGTPIVINARTGETWTGAFDSSESDLMDFAFCLDDQALILVKSKGKESSLESWDLVARRLKWSAQSNVRALAVSPNGTLVAAQEGFEKIILIDAATGQQRQVISTPDLHDMELRFDKSMHLSVVRTFPVKISGGRDPNQLTQVMSWKIENLDHVVPIFTATSGDKVQLSQIQDFGVRPSKCPSGARGLLVARSSLDTHLVQLADGKDLGTFEEVTAVCPNARFITHVQYPDSSSSWLSQLMARLGGSRDYHESYLLTDLLGWGRTVVLPNDLSTETTPTFSIDSSRVATESRDHRTIHVWDLPARPTLAQMLLWSLVVIGPLFLVLWWWSSRRRQSAS